MINSVRILFNFSEILCNIECYAVKLLAIVIRIQNLVNSLALNIVSKQNKISLLHNTVVCSIS